MQKIITLILVNLAIVTSYPDFYLYTQKNIDKAELVDLLKNSTYFIPKAELKILIHGFRDDEVTTSLRLVKNEILLKENVNVINVDWKDWAAFPDYIGAADRSKVVGSAVALFLSKNYIDPKKVHCIGHSLGAHACGFVGKKMKLNRISGLDPAGPTFRDKNSTERLDKSDAYFVDVIHVDSFYGIQEEIGHKNFYPSGGKSQPGCGLSGIFIPGKGLIDEIVLLESRMSEVKNNPVQMVACSHIKVPFYYAESVKTNCKFTAVLCQDYDSFTKEKCKCNLNFNTTTTKSSCSQMGYYSNLDSNSGSYYLEVGKSQPFCQPLNSNQPVKNKNTIH